VQIKAAIAMTYKGICIRHEAVRPPDVLQGNLGLEIHVVSMVFFSLMLLA
jgi:hypothetical protein